METMYTSLERGIQQKFKAAIQARGWGYPFYNNMISKKDMRDQHAAMGIMRYSDVFQAANGGGVKTQILTPVEINGRIDHYTSQKWPKPFDLTYQFTVIADVLDDCRNLDNLIRDVLQPQEILNLWDSSANGGEGGWSTSYSNYHYAGYVNRDVPDSSIYWRVTNIRFEVFNYQPELIQVPPIKQIVDVLESGESHQSQVISSDILTHELVVALTSTFGFLVAATPAGLRNSNNRVFTLPVDPAGRKVLVFLNGELVPNHDDVLNQINWTQLGTTLTTVGFLVGPTDNFYLVY